MMTNQQLYLAIGIPLVVNMAFFALVITILWQHIDSQFAAVNKRFDDMRELWRAELYRVEGVLDARLKHLEER